ncbi:MAG: MBL fold metallo-hydrolase [Methanobacteriota archaeon]
MNSIKFLGTAGARFVVMKQLRASGGLWISLDGTQVLIDPGPGSLLRMLSSRPKLDPKDLDGIILTHRHLDHSNDVNIIIEAMTNGGTQRKGVVFAPRDAYEDDPVVLQYLRGFVERLEVLQENKTYHLGTINFSTPIRHQHGVETYGLNIQGKHQSISLITDTQYFPGLETHYHGDVLVINVVRFEEKPGLEHLCVDDAEKIFSKNQPQLGVITHFGMTVLKEKPWEVAEMLSQKTGVHVLAARDGMTINLDQLNNDG